MATPRSAIDVLPRARTGPSATARSTGQAAGPSPSGAARQSAWRRQLLLNGWRLLLGAVLLVAWEVAATTVTSPFWISQPSRVFGRIVSLPTREQINLPVQEQLIVELYSK